MLRVAFFVLASCNAGFAQDLPPELSIDDDDAMQCWNTLSPNTFSAMANDELAACLIAGTATGASTRRGFHPLHWAVLSEPDVLEQVIAAASDINVTTVSGQTPLHIAVGVESAPGIVEMLLSEGTEPNTVDDENMSPLLQAIVAVHANVEVVQTLIEGGADVNFTIKDQHPALHKLMYLYDNINLDMFETLLQAGADVSAPSRWGEPPLILAARTKGSSDLFRLLLQYGADPDQTDPEGRTALHVAIQTERNLGSGPIDRLDAESFL